jgi:hypothetical protein
MLRIPHCLDSRLTDGGKVVSPPILDIFQPPVFYFIFFETHRERERESWGGLVRDTTVLEGVYSKQNVAVWKVPRQCPLVFLVKVRLVLRICSVLIYEMLERL